MDNLVANYDAKYFTAGTGNSRSGTDISSDIAEYSVSYAPRHGDMG